MEDPQNPTPPPANSGTGDPQPNENQPPNPAPSAGAPGLQDPATPAAPPVPTPPTQDENEEPPTRKTKLEYILERKQRKVEKLENQLKTPAAPQPAPNNQDPNPSGSADDYTPEEDAKFTKWFEKKYGSKMSAIDPLLDVTEKDHVDQQVNDFFKNDPHADLLKEFEGKIRKFAQHPSRAQVPIDEIVWGIAGKKLISYAAEAVRKAAQEARESRSGGGTARKPDNNSKKDYLSMDQKSFDAELQKVLQQG